MCGPRRIAVRIVLAILPGGLELATGAGSLFVHAATNPATYVTQQADTAGGFAVGAEHGHMKWRNLDRQVIRNRAASRYAFTKIEGHSKVRAASAAREAGIFDGHGR